MKKSLLAISLCFSLCCLISFVPKHQPEIGDHALSPAAMVSVTLTSGYDGDKYRITFSNGSANQQFTMPKNQSISYGVAPGFYTVTIALIVPSTPNPPTHSFTGTGCGTNYISYGTQAQFTNVQLCPPSAQFSIN